MADKKKKHEVFYGKKDTEDTRYGISIKHHSNRKDWKRGKIDKATYNAKTIEIDKELKKSKLKKALYLRKKKALDSKKKKPYGATPSMIKYER